MKRRCEDHGLEMRDGYNCPECIAEAFGSQKCEVCGERFKTIFDEVGEFVDPTGAYSDGLDGTVIAHAECGLAQAMEVA